LALSVVVILALFFGACSGTTTEIRPVVTGQPETGPQTGALDGGGPADAGSTVSGHADSPVDGGVIAAADVAPLVQLPVEIRAIWVTRWDFESAADIERIMKDIAGAGFNLVYFQVRGTADAYYRSTLEPWAAGLSGKLGKDPGWDPLQVAIDAAKKHGLELHAWINVSTAWKGKQRPGRSKPKHILRTHPEWRVADKKGRPMPYSGDYIFVNPANPDFQKHIRAVVAELASFYSIDGLHLDYARYPAADVSFDRPCYKLFKKARKQDKKLTRAAWQRRELTKLVKSLRAAATKVRPTLVVSAAVTGIYKDRWNWGSVTQGFVDFHQDSHLWAAEKAVDALVPMIYWAPTKKPGGRTDFLTLVKDFAPLSKQIQLIAGVSIEAGNFSVLEREIKIARKQALAGVAVFSYALVKKKNWFGKLKEGVFKNKALARGQKETIVSQSVYRPGSGAADILDNGYIVAVVTALIDCALAGPEVVYQNID
jgi:uncharacterized lipoprotein YddW (UPF0748 family)